MAHIWLPWPISALVWQMWGFSNAHSRKLANHKACVALWVAWYNFVRVNTAARMTSCMAAGVTDHIWNMTEPLQSE